MKMRPALNSHAKSIDEANCAQIATAVRALPAGISQEIRF